MSRSKAMTVKTVENIRKHYNAQMKHHLRRNDKVRFCLRLTPEQLEELKNLVEVDFPGEFVIEQKRKYLWATKKEQSFGWPYDGFSLLFGSKREEHQFWESAI